MAKMYRPHRLLSFYVIPPAGVVNYELLRELTIRRANFLKRINALDNRLDGLDSLVRSDQALIEFGDCLIEGSAKDVISHFTLRLACADQALARKLFVRSELTLFHYRLIKMNKKQLHKFVHHFCRLQEHFLASTVSDTGTSNPSLVNIRCLLLAVSCNQKNWSQVVDCHLSSCEGCRNCLIAIPFRFVPKLVAERRVFLSAGNAHVPSIYLMELLTAVFETWLDYGMASAQSCWQSVVDADARMKVMFACCKNILIAGAEPCSSALFESSRLNSHVIDEVAPSFPPCMLHLHSKLRQNHRLRHMSRVLYTLFLKSMGLPVAEAMEFWKAEYSKEVPKDNSYHGCRHDWNQHSQRYLYSIRHLYGLEGKRANYQCFSCKFIQNYSWGVAEEGGCPFVHHGKSSLRSLLLPTVDGVDWEEISALVDDGSYVSACSTYLLATAASAAAADKRTAYESSAVDSLVESAASTDWIAAKASTSSARETDGICVVNAESTCSSSPSDVPDSGYESLSGDLQAYALDSDDNNNSGSSRCPSVSSSVKTNDVGSDVSVDDLRRTNAVQNSRRESVQRRMQLQLPEKRCGFSAVESPTSASTAFLSDTNHSTDDLVVQFSAVRSPVDFCAAYQRLLSCLKSS